MTASFVLRLIENLYSRYTEVDHSNEISVQGGYSWNTLHL